MKVCCNVKENDARYCQSCLEEALLGRTKQVFKELDEWMSRFGVKREYDKIKAKFLQEIEK